MFEAACEISDSAAIFWKTQHFALLVFEKLKSSRNDLNERSMRVRLLDIGSSLLDEELSLLLSLPDELQFVICACLVDVCHTNLVGDTML